MSLQERNPLQMVKDSVLPQFEKDCRVKTTEELSIMLEKVVTLPQTEEVKEKMRIVEKILLERAELLFFFSFRLSQGNPGVQSKIFSWLKINYPNIKIDFEALRPQAIKKFTNLIIKDPGHKHTPVQLEGAPGSVQSTNIDTQGIERTIDQEISNWKAILDMKEKISDHIYYDLLVDIIGRDYQYIVKSENGRPNSQDKFFSYVCSYLLLGKPTGVKEYNKMCFELKILLQAGVRKRIIGANIIDNLKKVVEVHNQHHPNDQIDIAILN